jgi:hypothetical protein
MNGPYQNFHGWFKKWQGSGSWLVLVPWPKQTINVSLPTLLSILVKMSKYGELDL